MLGLALAVSGCAGIAPQVDGTQVPEVVDHDGQLPDAQAAKAVTGIAKQAPHREAFSLLLNRIGSLSGAPLYLDNRVELLIDGPDTYASMLEAIGNAQRFIHLETYILADDKVGRKFADALKAKALEGIEVRIIFDSLGSLSSSDSFFDDMREAGIEIHEFHDMNPLDGGNPLNANVRDHRKLLIIDGEVGFNGGINFSRTHSSRPGRQQSSDKLEDGWRDTHVAVYGPAVAALEKVFQSNWQASKNENHTSAPNLPKPKKAGDESVMVIAAKGGNDIQSPIYHAYLQAIRLAQERVWITQAYFVPDEQLLQALTSAANRGVDVRIVLPGMTDSGLVLHASRSHHGDLLEHGIRIFETSSFMLHAKTAVVDGVWSTVGSSNLDPRSTLHNDEVNVIVLGADFAGQMEAQFRLDLEDCREITLESWNKRPFSERLLEFFSRPLSYWL